MGLLRRKLVRVAIAVGGAVILAAIALTASGLMGGGDDTAVEQPGQYTTSSSCGISGCQSSAGAWQPGVLPDED